MLTKSEEQIMSLLWDTDKPLTATEIIGMSDDKTWKDSYVHLLINSLIKKGLIEVSGFVKTTKNYARSFSPTVTRESYSIRQIKEQKGFKAEEIPSLIAALIEDVDADIVNQVQEVLDKRKSEF